MKPTDRPAAELLPSISEPQRKTMEVIRELTERMGLPPTLSEVAGSLGISAPSAHQQIEILARKGYLRRERGKARGLFITRDPDVSFRTMVAVPILGRVAAGQPILAVENVVGEVLVDGSISSKGRCFALEVRGDSMVEAGIRDGDLVIVRQQAVAESGDVVVALFHDEATVKRLSIRDERIELRPENPRLKPIPIGPDDDLRILGKVVGVRAMEQEHRRPDPKTRRTRRKKGKT